MSSKETQQLTESKIKKRIKENHKRLKRTDLTAFRLTDTLKFPSNSSNVSLDTMSLHSTNSSDSGPLNSWQLAWTLDSLGSISQRSSRHSPLHRSREIKPEMCDNNSLTSGETRLKVREEQPSVEQISDACFLKSGYLLVTEPFENRVQIFSNIRHKLLGSLTDNHHNSKLSDSISFACGRNHFTPTSISETAHENVVAVSSQNTVVYIRATGDDSEVETHALLKDRTLLRALECTSNNRLLVSETTERAFLGSYDLGGKLVREFKNLKDSIMEPASITWSHDHHIAAVGTPLRRFWTVDVGANGILFLDQDGRVLNSFGSKNGGRSNFSAVQDPILSSPTGAAWCPPHHLIVTDNLSKELSVHKGDGLMNPVVVACNQRGNRMLITEETSELMGTSSPILGIDNTKINTMKQELLVFKRNSVKIDSSKRNVTSLKMFQRHGVPKINSMFTNGLFVD